MKQFDDCISKINFILLQGQVTQKSTWNLETFTNDDQQATIQIFRNYYFIEKYVSDVKAIQIYQKINTTSSRKLWPKSKKNILTWLLIKSHILLQYKIHQIPDPITIFISKILKTTPLQIKQRFIRMAKLPISQFPWMPEEDRCLKDIVIIHSKSQERKLIWRDIALQFNIQMSQILRSGKNCRQRWFDQLQYNQKANDIDKTINLMSLIYQDSGYNRWSDICNIMYSSEQIIHQQYNKIIRNNKNMEQIMNHIQTIIPMSEPNEYIIAEFYFNLVSITNCLQMPSAFHIKIIQFLPTYIWDQVGLYIYKSPLQLQKKWQEYSLSSVNPFKPWTIDEDQVLIQLVSYHKQFRTKIPWSHIGNEFNQNIHQTFRTGKKCRDRWLNILDPSIQKKKLKDQKDIHYLFHLVTKYGKKWLKIAGFMKTTENIVKNKYYGLIKKQKTLDNGHKITKNIAHQNEQSLTDQLQQGTFHLDEKMIPPFHFSGQFKFEQEKLYQDNFILI